MKFVLDIETNGLLMHATKVWCAVVYNIDSEEYIYFTPENISDLPKLLEQAEVIIGHNIIMFDLPVIKRLLGLNLNDVKIIDTLLWSRLLKPDLIGGHSLSAWGDRLNHKKFKFEDFSTYTKRMLVYCRNDVRVSIKLHEFLKKYHIKYKTAGALEHQFAYVISQQILNGFRLDLPFVNNLYLELVTEQTNLENKLREILPPVRVETHYNSVVKSGNLINEDEKGYTYTTPAKGILKYKDWEFTEPNPTSRDQLINFFKTKYDWNPIITTDKGTPKLDEKVLNTLPFDEAEDVARLFNITKQLGMIKQEDAKDSKAWLDNLIHDRTHGDVITNGTKTGRCSHTRPNMAQVHNKDKRMRQCWIARDGWDLVSCDADQIEARILTHFLYPYDGGNSQKIILEGDLHTENQRLCGFKDRQTAKNVFYAFMYGAAPLKIGTMAAKDLGLNINNHTHLKTVGLEIQNKLKTVLFGLDPLIKKLEGEFKEKGFITGIDGRPLFTKASYSLLNTLIQSTGAIVMKFLLVEWWKLTKKHNYIHQVDFGLCANVHDEIVFESHPDHSQHLINLLDEAIQNVTQYLDFKCPLTLGGKIGKNWAEIH